LFIVNWFLVVGESHQGDRNIKKNVTGNRFARGDEGSSYLPRLGKPEEKGKMVSYCRGHRIPKSEGRSLLAVSCERRVGKVAEKKKGACGPKEKSPKMLKRPGDVKRVKKGRVRAGGGSGKTQGKGKGDKKTHLGGVRTPEICFSRKNALRRIDFKGKTQMRVTPVRKEG